MHDFTTLSLAVEDGLGEGVGLPLAIGPAKSGSVNAKDTTEVSRIQNRFVNWDICSPFTWALDLPGFPILSRQAPRSQVVFRGSLARSPRNFGRG